MHHRAVCRCGAVAFEVEADEADALHGVGPAAGPAPERVDAALGLPAAHVGFGGALWPVARTRIRMQPPEPAIGAYTYSGWLVGHRFCVACGMHLFGEEIVDESVADARPMAYVNRECLDTACADAVIRRAAGDADADDPWLEEAEPSEPAPSI